MNFCEIYHFLKERFKGSTILLFIETFIKIKILQLVPVEIKMVEKLTAAVRAKFNEFAMYYHKTRTDSKVGRFFNEFIEMPATLSFLKNIKGKKILDIGCGSGIYTKILVERGAKVVGIDISKEFIKIAKKYSPQAEFYVQDINNLKFKKNTFDIVLCSLVLNYVKNVPQAIKEIYHVLKQDGLLIVSLPHPLVNATKSLRIKGRKYTRILKNENYFERKKIYTRFGENMIVPQYKRPFEDYINILAKYFKIVSVKEAAPIRKASSIVPQLYKEYYWFPFFIVLKMQTMQQSKSIQ